MSTSEARPHEILGTAQIELQRAREIAGEVLPKLKEHLEKVQQAFHMIEEYPPNSDLLHYLKILSEKNTVDPTNKPVSAPFLLAYEEMLKLQVVVASLEAFAPQR